MAQQSDRSDAELSQADQRRLEEYKELVAKNIRGNSDDWDGMNLKAMPLGMLVAIKRDEAKQDGHSLDHSRDIDGVVATNGPGGRGGVVVYQDGKDLMNTLYIDRHDLTLSQERNIQSVHELNLTLRQQEQQERAQQIQQDQRQQVEQRDAMSIGPRV